MITANRIHNVAVVGVTGTIGSHMTAALVANPQFTVTALTRADSAAQVHSPGVRVAPISYSDPSTIVAALRDQDVLIITLPARAEPARQTALIDAAALAGVRFVLPNEYGYDFSADPQVGVDVQLGPPLAGVRAHIETHPALAWIGVACGFWYDFSLPGGEMRFGFDFGGRKVTLFDDGARRIAVSTWAQVGRCVAALLALPVSRTDGGNEAVVLEDWSNRHVHFASLSASQNDMLASLERVRPEWKWEVTRVPVREFFAQGREEMMQGRFSGFSKCLYSRFFFEDNAGDVETLYGLDNERLGVGLEDIDAATRTALELWDSGYFEKAYGA